MADEIRFNLQGLDGVVQKMRGLAPKLQRSGLRKAARRAMNIVRDAARDAAKAIDDPETKEKIWKNIITQEATKQSRREGGVVMRVGVRGGAGANQHSKDASGNPGGDTRHWRYIEFGTQFTPAAPFMRPAFANNIDPVTSRFASELMSEIDTALR
ncbi:MULTISPECIES: HK97-gp10 family putative phage morphogenesis protein [Pseudomonas]|uniref:HK97-gp10 family putative phage morphogenesis protein n=1 Tax=Pseudomonas TaxID=286 RepID=UPI001F5758AD|nr:HK97-gp10 family putative phage morphogenesis protein [Pseudomonas sp. ArH3a]UNM18041.1 HK97 gp10 family phage protein [Pseudomonas sp. ArH3a]